MSRLRRVVRWVLDVRSPRRLLGTLGVAVVVSLVAGMAIGYAIERSRVHHAKTSTKSKTKTKTTTRKGVKPKLHLKGAPLLVGVVTDAQPKRFVVVDSKRSVFQLNMGPYTHVVVAESGSASSITVGSKIVFQRTASKATTASEVVVLPTKALMGAPVTGVVSGTSVTVKKVNGSTRVIHTGGATVLTTNASTTQHITKGERVLVSYLLAGTTHPALYIVVLPATSKFS